MNVKINTKGKFHAITIQEPELAANMTEELRRQLTKFLQDDIKNLIVIMKDIQKIDSAAAVELLLIRNRFYENQASFVLCEPVPAVKNYFEAHEQFEPLNITPTFSEASDLVLMEEIERELLN